MASCPVHLISAASLEGLWLLRCYREVRVWVLYHVLDPGIKQEVGDAGWVDTAAHGVTTCGSRILKVLLRHLEGSCSSGNRASAHPPGSRPSPWSSLVGLQGLLGFMEYPCLLYPAHSSHPGWLCPNPLSPMALDCGQCGVQYFKITNEDFFCVCFYCPFTVL